MKKKISLIIGSGQIGSRHLQGILKSTFNQIIYVYDTLKSSLTSCKLRELEVNHNNEVIYLQNWSELPNFFDLVIISTTANVRYNLLKRVINDFSFKNIILEKVLFQSPYEYVKALELISNNQQSQYWINLPRRQSVFYKNLKKRFVENNSIISVNIHAEDLGLACNSIHFIDLISFLTSSSLKSIDTSFLEEKIINSKRENFIEFYGAINAKFNNDVLLKLISSKKKTSINRTIFIAISSLKENIFISEGECVNPFAIFQDKNNPEKITFSSFKVKYQSEISGDIANDLFKDNKCDLPVYSDSYYDHKIFIESLLEKYNTIKSTKELLLPIT